MSTASVAQIGRAAWATFDYLVLTHSPENGDKYRELFSLLADFYPCGTCRQHIPDILRSLKRLFSKECLETKEGLEQLVYSLHDRVNYRLINEQLEELKAYVAKVSSDQDTAVESAVDAVSSGWIYTYASLSRSEYHAKLKAIEHDPRLKDAVWEFCCYLMQADEPGSVRLLGLILDVAFGMGDLGHKVESAAEVRKLRHAWRTLSVVSIIEQSPEATAEEVAEATLKAYIYGRMP